MSRDQARATRRFRPASLDALNFLLSDVRGALGPYLNVFLVTQQQWSQSTVGLVTALSGWLGLAMQTPIGAAIDTTPRKREAIVVTLAVLAAGAVCLFVAPRFWPVLMANAAMAVVGDVFAPAVAGLTLGLVQSQALARRLGRNAAFDHAGNVAIAAVAGAVGWLFSQRAVFLLAPVCAVLAAAAALSIPAAAIDARRARGAQEGERTPAVASPRVLLACRPMTLPCVWGCRWGKEGKDVAHCRTIGCRLRERRDRAPARRRWSPRVACRRRGAPEPPPHDGVRSPGAVGPARPARVPAD